MKLILYIALIISVITYSFWKSFYHGFFYHGNATVFLMLCTYLFLKDRNSFICFIFMSYSINNLLDELIFEPGVLGINEIIFAVLTPVIWILKTKRNARENITK